MSAGQLNADETPSADKCQWLWPLLAPADTEGLEAKPSALGHAAAAAACVNDDAVTNAGLPM